ncbi:hypothetical protein T492DRAFT_874220 [Pavlovales sp. CCMP2436]|nr:hypothetical protein T492DRAFT_874220 [Pavlovales sp. CCMP2436]
MGDADDVKAEEHSVKQVQDDKNALLYMLAHVKRRSKRDRELAVAKELELQSAIAVLAAELSTLERRPHSAEAAPPRDFPAALQRRDSKQLQPAREMRADEMIPDAAQQAQHRPKRLVLVKHARSTFAQAVDVDNIESLQQESERQVVSLERARVALEAEEKQRRATTQPRSTP